MSLIFSAVLEVYSGSFLDANFLILATFQIYILFILISVYFHVKVPVEFFFLFFLVLFALNSAGSDYEMQVALLANGQITKL